MLLKIFVALLAVAYALPEADPQANTRRPCTTKTSTVTSTIPATTKTRTVTRCTRRPKTTTVTSTATTCTRRPSTFTTTKTVTVTPTPSAVKPPAYLEVIIHPDALCGTKPVNQQFQNPNDDQITVAVPAGGSDCRNTIKTVSSFSFVKLNSGSFTSGCRLYYYSEQGCQNPINDGTDLSNNENKCINLPDDKMLSFQVLCQN